MEDVILKLILVINGEYHFVSKRIDSNTKEGEKIRQNIRKAGYTTNLAKAYAKRKNISIGDNTFEWKCPTCAYMTSCPKVLDQVKGSLKKYSFIENGAQLVLIDNKKSKEYNNALNEYKKRMDDPDFDLSLDKELAESLSKTGINVISTEVYKCRNYLNDFIGRGIPKEELDKGFLKVDDGYSMQLDNEEQSETKDYQDAETIKAEIERIKKMYGKK